MKTFLAGTVTLLLVLLVGGLFSSAGKIQERLGDLEGRVTNLETGVISQVILRRRPGGSELAEIRLTTNESNKEAADTVAVADARNEGGMEETLATDTARASLSSDAISATEESTPENSGVILSRDIAAAKERIAQSFKASAFSPTPSTVSFPTHGYSYAANNKGQIYFSVGGAEFSDSAYIVLFELAKQAKTIGAKKITISGSIDNSKAESSNSDLLKERVALVGKALQSLGAPGEIVLRPTDSSIRVYENETPTGRMKNRRAEIVID